MCNPNQYELQQKANLGVLTNDIEFKDRFSVLKLLAEKFEEAGVDWALSCSADLFLNGIVDVFHDFDLLISPNSVEEAEKVFSSIGEKAPKDPISKTKYFSSNAFSTYHIGNVDIDAISEFGVVTFGTQYQYHFNSDELEYINVGTTRIPVAPIESQYILYSMMMGWQPQRRFKRNLIAEYLMYGNIRHPNILENALNESIPWWIKEDIAEILKVSQ